MGVLNPLKQQITYSTPSLQEVKVLTYSVTFSTSNFLCPLLLSEKPNLSTVPEPPQTSLQQGVNLSAHLALEGWK